MQRLNARGANRNGDMVVEYLMATEYYLSSEGKLQDMMAWGGRLAADLGLEGQPVRKSVMALLAKGYSPTGEALCQNAGAQPQEVIKRDCAGNPRLGPDGKPLTKLEGGHRVGFDLTFSPDKAFSVAFAMAPGAYRDQLIDAHSRAVQVAMDYLEGMVETRRGKSGRIHMGVEGLIYSSHVHMANRDLEPNLHTHCLVYGVAKGTDGKWGTFDAYELTEHRNRLAADAIYRTELAHNCQALGLGIVVERRLDDEGQDTGMVDYKIAGLSDAVCEAFSQRRAAILAYQEAHGVDAQTACLATRRHKDEPAYLELVEHWRETLRGLDAPAFEALLGQASRPLERQSDAEVLGRLHANEAYFRDRELIALLGQELAGTVRAEGLMQEVDAFKTRNGLVRIAPDPVAEEDRSPSPARRHREERFAAPWMLEWEARVVESVQARAQEDHQQLPQRTVERAIQDYEQRRGFTLSAEQRQAVEHLTVGSGGVALLTGLAGTGKTTVSDCYGAAFRAEGRRMLGVCVSNAAARKLQAESGMECYSVAKALGRLERGALALTRDHVLVVDEAGMLDTDQTRRLLDHAQSVGAKVILQGDIQQLQPVGAGSGMALAKQATNDARLTEIRRQVHPEDRAIAALFYDQQADGSVPPLKKGQRSRRETQSLGGRILDALQRRGAVDDFDTTKQAMAALVQDCLASETPMAEKLVLGHTRVEVAALNAALRDGLRKQGHLAPEEMTISTRDNGKRADLPIARGDRIRFTASVPSLDLVNGSQANVLAHGQGPDGTPWLRVRVQSDIAQEDGRVLVFTAKDCDRFTHAYAMTVHKAQGQGKAEVYHLANAGMLDNQSALVAFTRLTRGRYRLYGCSDDIERLGERLGMERLKGTALEAGVRGGVSPKQPKPEQRRAPESTRSDDFFRWLQSQAQRLGQALSRRPEFPRAEKGRRRERSSGLG